jgi:hypothetical protein
LVGGAVVAVALALVASARAARVRSVFVRTCSTQPLGVSIPRSYPLSSATIGPLSLYSFGVLHRHGRSSSVPASRFAEVRPGRYRIARLWAVLPPAREVTLTVPRSERRVLSLAYDPELWSHKGWDGAARIADGAWAVTFRGCPRKDAQGNPPLIVFDGGLVSAGARCARLRVRVRGWPRARSLVVALGRRRC